MEPSNLLKIDSLDDNWRDKDFVMLHACFQLLKDCVEQENLLTGHIVWNEDKRHQAAKVEIESLYNWWMSYPNKQSGDLNKEIFAEETQMLTRLINIRWALWT